MHCFQAVYDEPIKRYFGHMLYSNIVISYATQTKNQDYVDDLKTLDVDNYRFVIDTSTTFHICRHRELFIGNVSKARHIFIKGVGGRIKNRGYGKIKIGIINDNNEERDLVINNVLYVPDCPTNLIIPQLWSRSTENPSGTGKVTVGNTKLLF